MNPAQNKLADAIALHQRGDLTGAERQYRSLLKASPDNPDLLYLTGMVCLETARAGMAAGFFERAIRAAEAQGRTADPEWRLAYGSALQQDGASAAALAVFDAVLADDPKSTSGLFCRATALQAMGRLDESINVYESLLTRAPGHVEAMNNLGAALRDSGHPEAATQTFRRALAINPDYGDALTNFGLMLEQGRHFTAAIKVLRRAAAVSAALDDDTEIALSRCLTAEGAVAQALQRLEALVRDGRETAAMFAEIGRLHLFRGDPAQAANYARRALAADSGCAAAHTVLVQSGGDGDNASALADIESALDSGETGSFDRASLYFAKAKLLGKTEEYTGEFESYINGNAAKRDRLAEIGYAYSRPAVEKAVGEQIAAFSGDTLAKTGASDSELPVFIVGMPRSGTTLIEQILASHPEIAGAGELMLLGEIAGRLRRKAGHPATPPPESLGQEVAETYLARLTRAGAGARRITDKMPSNFMHLGLIAMLFPRARIIHSRRDPMDTCLSCFFQNFAGTGLAFSYDLDDLGHYYRQYARLMEHWRQYLPGRVNFLEVDYEKLVGDQEGESRRLTEFLGLDWSDLCLSFHETSRTVTTASHSQVRQPIYSSSIGGWKRYGDQLGPLSKSLAG